MCVHPQLPTMRAVKVCPSGLPSQATLGEEGRGFWGPTYETLMPYVQDLQEAETQGYGSLCSDLGQAVTPNPQHQSWTPILCPGLRRKTTVS